MTQQVKVLLLNANWVPLHFISDTRALILLMKEKAEIVDMGGHVSLWNNIIVRSASKSHPVPATIRLLNRVNCVWKPSRFRKAILFERDRWECQYCGTKVRRDSATIDHVLPKSRGGATSWENCVTACKKCNKKKADLTPSEASMRLAKRPRAPKFRMWSVGTWHDDWNNFLNRQ
jgi:5-methylcytosine-specific restriction endonuclease McrA